MKNKKQKYLTVRCGGGEFPLPAYSGLKPVPMPVSPKWYEELKEQEIKDIEYFAGVSSENLKDTKNNT